MEHLNENSVSTLKILSALAQQFGPFFFALLFLLVITIYSQRAYRNAVNQIPASEVLIRSMRFYFHSSVGFGLFLVLIAILWFFWINSTRHIFHFSVVDLHQYQKLQSDDAYTKLVTKDSGIANVLQRYNSEFVIVRDRPFTTGERFRLSLWTGFGGTGPPAAQEIIVEYTGEPTTQYRLVEEGGSARLQKLTGASVRFVPTAYAALPEALEPPPRRSAGLLK